MYRLTVVAGPNRGMSYQLSEGENTIGRHSANSVVLSSSQVSKHHCVLIASNGQLRVQDQGSSNGTFVNGVLTKMRGLKAGDRLSIGEFVLEVSKAAGGPSRVPAGAGARLGGRMVPFPAGGEVGPLAEMPGGMLGLGEQQAPASVAVEAPMQANQMPKDLKGKALWYFESYVMPFFYGLNLKNEWKFICAGTFGAFLLLNLVVSVQPLLDANKSVILRETARRAAFMAKTIADRNAPYLAAGAETKTEIGLPETSEGVGAALLTDLDLRIISPPSKMNQYLVSGSESKVAHFAAKLFRAGKETNYVTVIDDTTVVAIEPVRVFDSRSAKNVTAAMAIVSIDGSIATMGVGEMSTVYSQTLILTGLLGALMLFILYRLTLRPFQVLNEDMDKALKGDIQQVTHEFKMEELNPLWDLINSALQRIPRSSGKGGEEMGMGAPEVKPEEFIGPSRTLADAARLGLVVFDKDRKIAYLNGVFEELSGIRSDGAIGQEISAVARDQSLGVLVQDLLDRAQAGGDGISEEYEFSGIGCTVLAAAYGAPGESAKAYLLAVLRKAE